MTSLIQKLTALQAAAHQAAWGVIEAETRERGWSHEDAKAARIRYAEAIALYKAAFGMYPEIEDRYAPGLPGDHEFHTNALAAIAKAKGSAA